MAACLRVCHRGSVQAALRATFRPDELPQLIAELGHARDEVQVGADVCEKTGVPKAFAQLHDLLSHRFARVDSALQSLRTKLEEKELGELLQWLSPIFYEDDHATASRDRVPGTGQWLFKRPEFREWEESASSAVFWLHGQGKAPSPSWLVGNQAR